MSFPYENPIFVFLRKQVRRGFARPKFRDFVQSFQACGQDLRSKGGFAAAGSLEALVEFLQRKTAGIDGAQLKHKINDDKHLLNALLNALRAGDVFWDIGSNVGIYSLIVSSMKGPAVTVVAFEPESHCYALLRQNIENASGDIRLFNCALSDRDGYADLRWDSNPESGVHRLMNSEEGRGAGSQSVMLRRGDALLKEHGLRVPSVIKIDVEGHEYEVLNGLEKTLRDPLCRSVLCEIHFSLLQNRGIFFPRKIIRFLKNHGFKQKHWLDASHVILHK
jgi:FkbM family methyltransferase